MGGARANSAQRLLALNPIAPSDGLRLLGRALELNAPQITILRLNESQLSRQSSSDVPPALSEVLRGLPGRATPSAAVSAFPALPKKLAAAPPHRRRAILLARVQQEAMQLLGCAPDYPFNPRQSLLEMGMDSLMATDLRNRLEAGLGLGISPTLVFDHPTAEAIVNHLSEQLQSMAALQDAKRSTEPAPPDESSPELLAEVRQLSDEELAQSIAAELAAIEGTGGD
jgi:acyl carrier protein